MDKKYGLSVYSMVDPMANYYNLEFRHDHNMALWQIENNNVTLLHHWEFERITGQKKHHTAFSNLEQFQNFVMPLLRSYNLKYDDLDFIIGTPEIQKTNYYKNDFGGDYTLHSAAHLYSSLLMDTNLFYNSNIIAFALDGGSDTLIDRDAKTRKQFIGAVSQKGKVEYYQINSPGQLWGIAKNILKLEEGTLMALAYSSDCTSLESFEELKKIVTKQNYINIKVAGNIVREIINKVFSYTSADKGIKFKDYDDRFTEEENKISMCMKVIQQLSIDMIDSTIEYIMKKYELDATDTYLALSGGYALNCPTNTYLMMKYKFKGQLIPPFAGDDGQAIGMGLYYLYKTYSNFNFRLTNAFYGDREIDVMSVLMRKDIYKYIDNIRSGIDLFVSDIIENPIIWIEGRAESGPRALGHRSILADPRTMKSKELLNLYKQRQWWRPVAPIILDKHKNEWFNNAFSSPYMLNNFIVANEEKDKIPAVVHLDGSARIQTIDEKDELLYSALNNFFKFTNVPVLCNTSLNDKGEPIINKLTEALNFALRKKIRVIYIDGIRVQLRNFNEYEKDNVLERDNTAFEQPCTNFEKINPFHLTGEEYAFWYQNYDMQKYDINREEDVLMIKKKYRKLCVVYNNEGYRNEIM